MTLLGPVASARQNRGPSITRIGVGGLVGAIAITVVVQDTAAGLDQGALLSRLLVVLGGSLAVIAMSGLILAGRAVTALEELPR